MYDSALAAQRPGQAIDAATPVTFPLPDTATVRRYRAGANSAPTRRSLGERDGAPVPSAQPPDQRTNRRPGSGLGASATCEPASNSTEHAAAQSMPGTSLRTDPPPVGLTVSIAGGASMWRSQAESCTSSQLAGVRVVVVVPDVEREHAQLGGRRVGVQEVAGRVAWMAQESPGQACAGPVVRRALRRRARARGPRRRQKRHPGRPRGTRPQHPGPLPSPRLHRTGGCLSTGPS